VTFFFHFAHLSFPREACLGGELHVLCLASSRVLAGREEKVCGRVSQNAADTDMSAVPGARGRQNWWLYIAWNCGSVQTAERNSHCTEGRGGRYLVNVGCRLDRRRRFAVMPATVTIDT
jgi:hypothetical protein